jgi:hypothetical protein
VLEDGNHILIDYKVHSLAFVAPTEFSVKVKVKESRNRPGVAQRVPGGLGSQIP